jgi:hypothetical protein
MSVLGKNAVKGATQVNGHSLKLHFCVFEKPQVKHNSLDCHKDFWNIFPLIVKISLTQI